MRVFFLSFVIVSLSLSCSQQTGFNESDLEDINLIRSNYTNGWLANDKETILNLFSEEATIVPSGLNPITGIENIQDYWFPNDSSETIIHAYSIELLGLSGTDSIAYALEKGTLNFTYTKGDFTMNRNSTSHATTVYRKNQNGNWKIELRMWTTLKN